MDVGFCVLGLFGSLVIAISLYLSLCALIVCNLWVLGLYKFLCVCLCVIFLTISSTVTFSLSFAILDFKRNYMLMVVFLQYNSLCCFNRNFTQDDGFSAR